MQGDQVEELNQLEEFLRQPDAVMEPNILSVLRRYISDKGRPADAVEMLCDSYAGYAQMASLVVEWTKELQDEGNLGDGSASVAAFDEAYYLRELAKDLFDPDKFSGVFTSGGSGPPRWLDGPSGLTADREGRQLIYELSAKHRNCLLLNYAIQKILQAGHEDEVASVGSSLASYFGVFHRLMANRLKEVAAADTDRVESLAAELKETCCQGQHTYVHAQQILTELGQHPRGSRFRRLSQELEAHAAKQRGAIVWQMHAWFAAKDSRDSTVAAEVAVAQMLGVAEARSRARPEGAAGRPGAQQGNRGGPAGPSEAVHQLHSMYTAEDPPPISCIRHPQVFKVLLEGLFTPGAQLSQEEHRAHVDLLALAAAAVDGRPDGMLDLEDVEATKVALQQAHAVAQSAALGIRFGPREQAQAEAAARCAVAAAGLLRSMAGPLGSKQYWRDYHGSAAPAFLTLLSLIVPLQPALNAQAVDIISDTLKALGNAKPDIARALLELAVAVMAGGEVMRMLSAAEQWAKTADPSLVRHFIFCVLAAASPPFSSQFASPLIRLMQGSGVKRSRAGAREGLQVEQLEEFAAACAHIDFQPPLSAKQAAFLQSLQAERLY
ncbi:Negative elongation factor D [Coccomyxa sp. Obi]|nr:Negative elongation factor D [Coccomyxa sp. Obi]